MLSNRSISSGDDYDNMTNVVTTDMDMDYNSDRIHNRLLDEICSDIGMSDSIELDFFDIDHFAAYQNRLSSDLQELDHIIPFGRIEAAKEIFQSRGPPLALRKINENIRGSGLTQIEESLNGGNDSIGETLKGIDYRNTDGAVASPTISSSCEGLESNTAVSRPNSTGLAAVDSTTTCVSAPYQDVIQSASNNIASQYNTSVTDDVKLRCSQGNDSVAPTLISVSIYGFVSSLLLRRCMCFKTKLKYQFLFPSQVMQS